MIGVAQSMRPRAADGGAPDDLQVEHDARAARRAAFRRIRRFRASLAPLARPPSRSGGSDLKPSARIILAALQAAAPEPVPLLTLALLVWPERPERRAVGSLQNHVSKLRATLLWRGVGQEVQSISRDGGLCYRLVPAGYPRHFRTSSLEV